MFLMNQPYAPSARAHLQSQLSLATGVANQLINTVQKINELNIQVMQKVMEESITNAQQIMSAQNPFELMSIAAGQAQPTAEKLRAYQQHLTNIATQAQLDLSKTAETYVPETSRTARAMADEVARTASEETQKAVQRQKAVVDKVTSPVGKAADAGKPASGPNMH